jgi:hypothetical protein
MSKFLLLGGYYAGVGIVGGSVAISNLRYGGKLLYKSWEDDTDTLNSG